MATRYYRFHSGDAETLLDPNNQYSQGWHTGDDIRHGVSVMADLDDLVEYAATVGMDFWGSTLVILAGTPSDDEDHDVVLGAELVIPTEIISAAPIDDDLAARIDARQDELWPV